MDEMENDPMNPGDNPDDYFNKKILLRAQLNKMGEPVTDRRFKDICIQGITDEYNDVKLMVFRDPSFALGEVQSTMRNIFLDSQSRLGDRLAGLLELFLEDAEAAAAGAPVGAGAGAEAPVEAAAQQGPPAADGGPAGATAGGPRAPPAAAGAAGGPAGGAAVAAEQAAVAPGGEGVVGRLLVGQGQVALPR
eukprot:g20045.t1